MSKWNKELLINELKNIEQIIGHFPKQKELYNMKRSDLVNAISRNGGINKFRDYFGYESAIKPNNYWNEKNVEKSLKDIIEQLGHFPTQSELINMNRHDLIGAYNRYGGLPKFRILLGVELPKKPDGYWTEKIIIRKLKELISTIGHFPTHNEIDIYDYKGLAATIMRHGGINKYRKLLSYEYKKVPNGYWTEETICNELTYIIKNKGYFPPANELDIIYNGLSGGIRTNGGFNKFRSMFGYQINRDSEMISYYVTRGKKTEQIILTILEDYCNRMNLQKPKKNVKLCKGNVLEFVCKTKKTVGIDVTNVKSSKSTIYHKWTKKEYYKYLDELWIVVVSSRFTEEDYTKWNQESPDNVYIYSIEDFCKELEYDIEASLKNKIEKYKVCTFHTRNIK